MLLLGDFLVLQCFFRTTWSLVGHENTQRRMVSSYKGLRWRATNLVFSYFMVTTNKSGCSSTANNMRQSLPAFVEFINFSVMSQFHCMQAILLP